MPYKPIQIRAKHTDGITTVRALISHPMSGNKPGSKASEPTKSPHFIQEITCSLENREIMTAFWGDSVANDPLLGFTFKGGEKGQRLRLKWVDSQGNSDSIEIKIV